MKYLVLNGTKMDPGASTNAYVCNNEIGYCPVNRPCINGCSCYYLVGKMKK